MKDLAGAGRKPTNISTLLSWMNGTSPRYLGVPSKASRMRILALCKLIHEATALLSDAVERGPVRNFWENPPDTVQDALKKIESMLLNYPMWPGVEIKGEFGDGGLHFEYGTGHGRPTGEQISAWVVFELARNQRLHLLRQCICGSWFLAKRKDQKACSGNCRHKAYEKTEAYRTMRRDYMRRYYALKKSGKVR
jgi:hypothetical protein